MAKLIHFCSGLEATSGMAVVARLLAEEARAAGVEVIVTDNLAEIRRGADARRRQIT